MFTAGTCPYPVRRAVREFVPLTQRFGQVDSMDSLCAFVRRTVHGWSSMVVLYALPIVLDIAKVIEEVSTCPPVQKR